MLNALPKKREGPFRVNQSNLYRDFENQRKEDSRETPKPKTGKPRWNTIRPEIYFT
jgi:hypothetical protein